jgi:Tol biopolymer transport system component
MYGVQIWVMNAEPPFEPARLIPRDCSGATPTWSPDSARVAYQGWNCMESGIYIINADGTGNVRLPVRPDLSDAGAPDWSPDGERFAFLGNGDDGRGLWTMRNDGSDPIFLVDTANFGSGPPDWSPDGAQIAFIDGPGLSIVNADGTGLTVLREDALQPKWRSVAEG